MSVSDIISAAMPVIYAAAEEVPELLPYSFSGIDDFILTPFAAMSIASP